MKGHEVVEMLRNRSVWRSAFFPLLPFLLFGLVGVGRRGLRLRLRHWFRVQTQRVARRRVLFRHLMIISASSKRAGSGLHRESSGHLASTQECFGARTGGK